MRFFLSIVSVFLIFGLASAFVAPTSVAASARTRKATSDYVGPPTRLSRPTANTSASSLLSVPQSDAATSESFIKTPLSVLGSLWGTGGVLYILFQAFKHTFPSALEPIQGGGAFFSPLQWSAYGATVAVFAYGQGYRCLHRKLAPLVVKRSCALDANSPQRTAANFFLAPLYAMGLISGTKSRLIKSHSLVWGTAALQIALQRGTIVSDGPLLNVLNAGFAAGFAWGGLSLIWEYASSFFTGRTPKIDAGLPSA